MISILTSIFLAFAVIIKFIKSILVKYLVHSVIISAQFTITASTILFVLSFYFFAVTSLVAVYNLGIDIFNYASSSTLPGVSCLFGLLDCIGFSAAAQIGYSLMYSALSTIMIFHLFKFTLSAMRMIMNEIFKLGLLIGQAMD